jgi:hypothetical protein
MAQTHLPPKPNPGNLFSDINRNSRSWSRIPLILALAANFPISELQFFWAHIDMDLPPHLYRNDYVRQRDLRGHARERPDHLVRTARPQKSLNAADKEHGRHRPWASVIDPLMLRRLSNRLSHAVHLARR